MLAPSFSVHRLPAASTAVQTESSTMEPLLLTPAQAASALGIGRSSLYELLAEGAIPSVKIGSSRRVRTADLRAYIEGLAAA